MRQKTIITSIFPVGKFNFMVNDIYFTFRGVYRNDIQALQNTYGTSDGVVNPDGSSLPSCPRSSLL